MKTHILKSELWGIVFIILFGGVLHFVFDWSGNWTPLAPFAAVNESVWEHLKLGYWPALILSLIEYRYIKNYSKNFFVARVACLYIIPFVIIVLFYAYTAFISDFFVADLIIFVVAVVIGQLSSYCIMEKTQLPKIVPFIVTIAFILSLVSFALLTYFPPNFTLFKDPVSGGYGIIE
jgi:hypothetical protein